jgi:hypothetical protein
MCRKTWLTLTAHRHGTLSPVSTLTWCSIRGARLCVGAFTDDAPAAGVRFGWVFTPPRTDSC